MQNAETNRIENKERLNEDFEQEVIAFLNYREGGAIYVGINKNGQPVGIDDIDQVQLQIKEMSISLHYLLDAKAQAIFFIMFSS